MSVLVDTSAWIEFLRRSGSAAALAVERAVRASEVAVSDVIVMEVLAGTTDPARLSSWERALDGVDYIPQSPREDAESAAALYRACRRGGESPRQLNDCLVAAIAIRRRIPVLHHDRDFEVIARHTALETVLA